MLSTEMNLTFLCFCFTFVSLTRGSGLRSSRDQAMCRAATLTRDQCREQGSEAPANGCYIDTFSNMWNSCSEICTAERLKYPGSRMKCEDYCPEFYEKSCHQYTDDARTDSQRLIKLEADLAQVLLNQRKLRKMLATLVGKQKEVSNVQSATASD